MHMKIIVKMMFKDLYVTKPMKKYFHNVLVEKLN